MNVASADNLDKHGIRHIVVEKTSPARNTSVLLTVQVQGVACQRPAEDLARRAGRSGTGNRGWGQHASPHSSHSRASKCPRVETCRILHPTTRKAIVPLQEDLSAGHCEPCCQLSILITVSPERALQFFVHYLQVTFWRVSTGRTSTYKTQRSQKGKT